MKPTLKAIGLFLLITGAVTSGVLIADAVNRNREGHQRAAEIRRETCTDLLSDRESYGENNFIVQLAAKCKAEGF